MAIAIQLENSFDIETYDGLIAFIIAHLELDSETAAQLPSLIRLAEYELNRILLPHHRERQDALTTTAGQANTSMPADITLVRSAWISDYPLSPVPLNVLRQFETPGKPQVYCIVEDEMYFGPTPDDAYLVTFIGQVKIPALSAANQTNWLLQQHADAYVYAILIETLVWQNDEPRALTLRPKLDLIARQINDYGNRHRNASPMRLRSPGTIV